VVVSSSRLSVPSYIAEPSDEPPLFPNSYIAVDIASVELPAPLIFCCISASATFNGFPSDVAFLSAIFNPVNAWDESQRSERERGRRENIDVKKLLEDNTQLFKENEKLIELNQKLKDVIEQRIPHVEQSIGGVNEKFEHLENVLNKL
jgi:hypothetical protein